MSVEDACDVRNKKEKVLRSTISDEHGWELPVLGLRADVLDN